MKYHTLIICILAVAILYPSKAHAFDYPNDQPTIEALISLHKLIKKEEEKALQAMASRALSPRAPRSSTMCA